MPLNDSTKSRGPVGYAQKVETQRAQSQQRGRAASNASARRQDSATRADTMNDTVILNPQISKNQRHFQLSHLKVPVPNTMQTSTKTASTTGAQDDDVASVATSVAHSRPQSRTEQVSLLDCGLWALN